MDPLESTAQAMQLAKFKFLQWEISNSISVSLVYNNRCINQRLGSHIPGDINKWIMVKGRTENRYKHARTKALTYLNKKGDYNKDLLGLFKQVSVIIMYQVVWASP